MPCFLSLRDCGSSSWWIFLTGFVCPKPVFNFTETSGAKGVPWPSIHLSVPTCSWPEPFARRSSGNHRMPWEQLSQLCADAPNDWGRTPTAKFIQLVVQSLSKQIFVNKLYLFPKGAWKVNGSTNQSESSFRSRAFILLQSDQSTL